MKWLFEDVDLVARMQSELLSWLGTPFRPHSKAKGATGGVDCIGLCEAVYVDLGICSGFNFPRTPMDYSMHQDNSIMLDYLRGQAWRDPQSARLAHMFAEIHLSSQPYLNLLTGDLLAFRIGKCVHHLAIAFDAKRFLHCFSQIGVTEANIDDQTYRSRIVAIFRARRATS